MVKVILCENLSKSFKAYKKKQNLFSNFFRREWFEKKAVEDFSLSIEKGEFVGFLGPNGAGKTTLMKMFSGIVQPSKGSLEVLGFKPYERPNSFREKISLVMGQKFQMLWDLPPYESLKLFQRYYQISESVFKKRLDYFCDILKIGHLLHVNVRKLSLGERMKFEFMSCLLHSPEVIFLDEPTIGLDLIAQKSVRQFLRDYHKEYKPTIILTSHYMADIDALCPRIVLIMEGSKYFDGPMSKFVNILGTKKLMTFFFSEAISSDVEFLNPFEPHWSEDRKQVSLQIPLEKLRDLSQEILKKFPVTDLQTEKLPIERVTETLFNNPKLLKNS